MRAETTMRPTLLALLTTALVLLPLAACAASPEGQQPAMEEGSAAGDESTAAAGADDYAERMAREHAGETPVPAFAAEADESAGQVDVTAEPVQYATVGGAPVRGYLAMPEGAGARPDAGLPGLIVIHEWWGLNDNVETMARLFAHHGYVALAVDLYGGESAETAERARQLMSGVDEAKAKDNLRQAYDYLVNERHVSRVGVIGWCFGGGWSLQTALLLPDRIDATVIYYGRLVDDRDALASLQMPILGFFGAEDQGIPVAGVRKFESTLKELGKDVEIHVYDGAGHAFANPSGERYQPQAAKDAWQRTLAFFDQHLKGTSG